MRKILISLFAGFLLFGAFDGRASGEPATPATPVTPASPAFAFPVIQCTFDISFMNTEKNIALLRQCPHFADKTRYVVIFSNITVRADDAVAAGAFTVKTGNEKVEDMAKGAQVIFKISPPAAAGAGFVWTAPGPIVREDIIQSPGPGAIAAVQFIDKGCGQANCAIAGTVTIRAKDP